MRKHVVLALVGDSGVGKTCLMSRLMDDTFPASCTPRSYANVGIRTMEMPTSRDERVSELVSGDTIGIETLIYDLTGIKQRRRDIAGYILAADVALVVYNAADRRSFENVRPWVERCRRAGGSKVPDVFLVGNGYDDVGTPAPACSGDAVSVEEGIKLANKLGLHFVALSAKTNQGVYSSSGVTFGASTNSAVQDVFVEAVCLVAVKRGLDACVLGANVDQAASVWP